MAIAMNKIKQSAPSASEETITLTRAELNDILASFKQEIIEEVKKEMFAPLRDSIVKAKEQSAQTTETLEQLEKKLDEIYRPIKQKNAAAAAARLAARKDEDEEDYL